MKCAEFCWISFSVRCRSTGDVTAHSGSVTAEFAAVVPAVILVLAVSLAGVQSATRQLQLQDAAALAARSAARGSAIESLVSELIPGATARVEVRGNLVCVRARASGTFLSSILGATSISASSCALAGGR
jgi:hypothetical protein